VFMSIPVVASTSSTWGSIICLSSRDLDVQNDADLVIDGRVLLVARIQSPVARIRGHCCIGIGRAKLLVLSTLPAFSLDLRSLLGLVLAQHILHVPLREAIPAHIGTDERGDDMHNLGRGDLRRQAGLNRALEDLADPIFSPALAESRQARIMRQLLMEAIAEEPADIDVDLSLTHQLAVVHDAGTWSSGMSCLSDPVMKSSG